MQNVNIEGFSDIWHHWHFSVSQSVTSTYWHFSVNHQHLLSLLRQSVSHQLLLTLLRQSVTSTYWHFSVSQTPALIGTSQTVSHQHLLTLLRHSVNHQHLLALLRQSVNHQHLLALLRQSVTSTYWHSSHSQSPALTDTTQTVSHQHLLALIRQSVTSTYWHFSDSQSPALTPHSLHFLLLIICCLVLVSFSLNLRATNNLKISDCRNLLVVSNFQIKFPYIIYRHNHNNVHAKLHTLRYEQWVFSITILRSYFPYYATLHAHEGEGKDQFVELTE
jgi:hypothetical protein